MRRRTIFCVFLNCDGEFLEEKKNEKVIRFPVKIWIFYRKFFRQERKVHSFSGENFEFFLVIESGLANFSGRRKMER